MADTRRTLSALQTLLANNITGAVSPQDMRDVLVSLMVRTGHLSQQGNVAETSITGSVTYFDINLSATSLGGSELEFDESAEGQLRYTGIEDILVSIVCSFSIISAGNNKVYHIRLAKNGTSIASTELRLKIATGADVGEGVSCGQIVMSQNDYITLEIKNATDTTNATITEFSLNVKGFMI